MTPSCNCSVIATLLSGKTEAGRQDCKNIFSSRQVHKAGLLFLPQRSYVREISSRFVQHTISRAWTPHAIFLSDRNDPLWECWYNLSNLTNQRVYQELVHRNGLSKEMITGSAAPSLPSFLLFYFHLRALSIQRAQLSRSLEQAMQEIAGLIQGPEKGPHKMAAWLYLRRLKNTFLISTFFLSTNDTPFFFHNCLKND